MVVIAGFAEAGRLSVSKERKDSSPLCRAGSRLCLGRPRLLLMAPESSSAFLSRYIREVDPTNVLPRAGILLQLFAYTRQEYALYDKAKQLLPHWATQSHVALPSFVHDLLDRSDVSHATGFVIIATDKHSNVIASCDFDMHLASQASKLHLVWVAPTWHNAAQRTTFNTAPDRSYSLAKLMLQLALCMLWDRDVRQIEASGISPKGAALLAAFDFTSAGYQAYDKTMTADPREHWAEVGKQHHSRNAGRAAAC